MALIVAFERSGDSLSGGVLRVQIMEVLRPWCERTPDRECNRIIAGTAAGCIKEAPPTGLRLHSPEPILPCCHREPRAASIAQVDRHDFWRLVADDSATSICGTDSCLSAGES